jgi:hypothetical protein
MPCSARRRPRWSACCLLPPAWARGFSPVTGVRQCGSFYQRACLIALSPARSWLMIGMMILGSGMFGLAHCCLAWRDTLRDSLLALMDLEDRVWYIVLPFIGYACVAASGVTLALRLDIGCVALALSAGLLMAVGIHNAWDITVWSISRRQQ